MGGRGLWGGLGLGMVLLLPHRASRGVLEGLRARLGPPAGSRPYLVPEMADLRGQGHSRRSRLVPAGVHLCAEETADSGAVARQLSSQTPGQVSEKAVAARGADMRLEEEGSWALRPQLRYRQGGAQGAAGGGVSRPQTRAAPSRPPCPPG